MNGIFPPDCPIVTIHVEKRHKSPKPKKEKTLETPTISRVLQHRSDWIRTSGLLVPNQALYQTEPHPDSFNIIP